MVSFTAWSLFVRRRASPPPSTYWIGVYVGPRASLDEVAKRKFPVRAMSDKILVISLGRAHKCISGNIYVCCSRISVSLERNNTAKYTWRFSLNISLLLNSYWGLVVIIICVQISFGSLSYSCTQCLTT